jgi:hypothetical protein
MAEMPGGWATWTILAHYVPAVVFTIKNERRVGRVDPVHA